jgi:hypothetical protein
MAGEQATEAGPRDWSANTRAVWWIKYALAIGTGLAGVRTADEAIAWYLQSRGMQTVERAKVDHDELAARIDADRAEHVQIVERIEAKLDKMQTRIDAAITRGRR